jgi:GNAT superfamily N-acetyltransferase
VTVTGLQQVSPEAFIEEFEGLLQEAKDLVGKVAVELSPEGRSAVSIDYIEVIDPSARRTGLGTKVLSLLTDLADSTGMALEVIRRQMKGQMSNEALTRWYSHRGFEAVRAADPARQMRRAPAPPVASQLK